MLYVQRSKERLSVLQDQITQDKRITRLSDDPTGAALIMDFATSIERNRAYVKQGESASSFLTGTESALKSLDIQIDRLLELGQQGLSDINEGRGRDAIGAEVDGVLTILLDVSNAREQGKYLFSGTATSTLPFTKIDGPLDWSDPTTVAADYHGNLFNIDLDISPVASVTTNLTGEWVFQGTRDVITGELDPNQDLFTAVAMMRDGMINDDRALIQQGYDNIRAIKERINVCLATVGNRQVSIENTGMNLEDFNESLQSIQNTYDEVDYPWAITQFYAESNSQQAAYSILSKMGQNSLFNYIG
jgi:flagellar hook-associated protein 3 FlgL